MRNEPSEDPTRKLPFSSRNLVKAYRDGAERFGWHERRHEPRSGREGEWLVGMGVASGFYPYFRMPSGAVSLTLNPDGRVLVSVAAHEMGMGTSTTVAIMAAKRLGLPLDRVTVDYGSSTLPGLVIAGGSQQTVSIGVALMAAQKELFKKLLKGVASDSPLHGVDVDEVQAVEGGLQKHNVRETHRSYAMLLADAGLAELVVEGTASIPLESEHWSMATYSAVFCEARVNAVTREVRIARLLGSFDCGRVMNPKTAASQLRGGMVMGIGMA